MKQEYKKLLKLIKKYSTIIIHRHYYPDGDAYGSQIGLSLALKNTFKDKNIYVVGDLSNSSFGSTMDTIEDSTFKDSLSIILDVSDEKRCSDTRFKLAKEVVIIDHHENEPTIDSSLTIVFPKYSSTCEIVVEFLKESKLIIDSLASTFLYYGMITDTGRFLYLEGDKVNLFSNISYICKYNPDIKKIYDYLYTEKLSDKLEKMKFSSFELTKNKVAYRFNTKEIMENSIFDFNKVNRGMINSMAGIEEIPIWASFTYNKELNKIFCEFRSRDIIIVDVAKKYGGGGHNFACGCSIDTFDKAYDILNDLDEKVG